ncbi:hypothetical protein QN277_029443 [Acacia crassicarpa]|uniref:Pectinesterase inhibitor domain-containing protein n=1 Tax=Acacia crassicarpa TaxID=499986 RepID=A0AAE1K2Q2_9FABA|nr:hypothetical protein QN277_029443 [Acacia crassicarpa]
MKMADSFFLCFLLFILLNPSSSLANHASELVNEVCVKTSNYTFCVESLYSDPHTPEADSYGLAVIAFRLAYINATTTRDYILKLLKKASSNSSIRRNLQRCASDYYKAVSAIETAYNDLNSETFFELADLAAVASRSADDCEASYKRTRNSPFTSLNKALKGLCEICVAISKRFTGS